jgi:maltose alpha-D-glucosyltransferase/alpha-amylase
VGLLISKTADVWWKNALIYCLDVETFQDSDGDGIGDFNGLTSRIDYLAELGVTCIWLMPFYPSPNRDDGYDIIDYYAVDRRLGTLGDFVEFVRTARDRGMRVIADLVVNHTSDQHPWFKSARADLTSPFRDYYVWQDEVPKDSPKGLVFPDEEDSNWEFDKQTEQYYLHRFYKHQPDLNIANPQVRNEIAKIIGFWLELGLSGFRVDAVPFMLEIGGIDGADSLDPHHLLRDLRAFLNRRRGDAMLLGEVNLEPEGVRRFYGDEDGDELHMCLNFNLNQAMALSIVREDAGGLIHSLRGLPRLPEDSQWANFVRNHDEWSLDKLTDSEREEAFQLFGPKDEMQLFGRGVRRRLPSMLDNDQARIRMVYSLTAALPGAFVLFYGEEIGMAENLSIPGRASVRSPMQWSPGKSGGFSTADSDQLRRPMVKNPEFGPEAVNVVDQRRAESSMLRWMQRLLACRRMCPEVGWSPCRIVESGQAGVLVLRYDWGDETVLTMHNLGAAKTKVVIDVDKSEAWQSLIDLMERRVLKIEKSRIEVTLPGFGLLWARVDQA